jgi:hypothetical protein
MQSRLNLGYHPKIEVGYEQPVGITGFLAENLTLNLSNTKEEY